MNKQKKILICPLDWGLGHATRCMPLINYLLEKKCEVLIAGNEVTNHLLRSEFPDLQFLELQPYNVRYSKSASLLPLKLLMQVPRLMGVIRYEHQWLQQMIDIHHIDMVISDNRYGLHSKEIPVVFITHQLHISVPQSTVVEKLIAKLNHHFIKRFAAVWVPDYPSHELAGKLSTSPKQLAVQYLGNLSRFAAFEHPEIIYDKTFLLSGPEPQRSKLEDLILKQLLHTSERILLIRGKPGTAAITSPNPNIQIENHLAKNALQQAILQSELVFCRSGYSTIMDLIKLKKAAILIPTPGQTEQEYLARFLSEKKWFVAIDQAALDVNKAANTLKCTALNQIPDFDHELYKQVIDRMLEADKL